MSASSSGQVEEIPPSLENTVLVTSSCKMTAVFKFGLVADMQYANIDDGYNWNKTKKRYYRNAICLLQKAMKEWRQYDVRFILQLGDMIDGFCKQTENPDVCLDRVLDIFEQETWPVLNVVGNHELYNFPKDKLYTSRLFKTLPLTNKAYYVVEPHPGIKICALNTYEISTLGTTIDTPEYKQASEFLRVNPNDDKNDPVGLIGVKRRFVRFNGAVSTQQIDWLKEELSSAKQQKQNVIVIGHNPIYLVAQDAMCLCWNYSDVHDTLSEFKSCVVCYISGHDHDGGIAVDQYGIHHITMPGVIENPESYAVGCVYEDSIKIEGKGDMFNVTCPLRFKLES